MIRNLTKLTAMLFIAGCVCLGSTGCSFLSVEESKKDVTATIDVKENKSEKDIMKFYSADKSYIMEMDFSNLPIKFESMKNDGTFLYQCTDTDNNVQMLVKTEFTSDYGNSEEYYNSIKKTCENQKMIIPPTEYTITVNDKSSVMLNYFFDSNHSSGSWDYFYKIDDKMGLIVYCYGINEHQPGDKKLAENIIESIISNSVIRENK